MKDLKVSKKLTISYAIILTLLIMSCVVSIVDFIRLGGQIETFYDGPFTVNDSAVLLIQTLNGCRSLFTVRYRIRIPKL